MNVYYIFCWHAFLDKPAWLLHAIMIVYNVPKCKSMWQYVCAYKCKQKTLETIYMYVADDCLITKGHM